MENAIEEIKESIEKNSSTFTSMGVSKGKAGIALFYYYLIKYDGNPTNKEKLIQYLGEAIEGLNNDYQGNNIVSDIIEIATLIDFFCDERIICKEDVDFYFENFDPLISDLLHDEIRNKNISASDGAIKIGRYFLSERKPYSKELELIINLIADLSTLHHESLGIYWHSSLKRNGMHLIELSGSNGLTSIVNFTSEIFRRNIQKKESQAITTGILNYILYHKKEFGKSLFPFDSELIESSQNYNLAYGDLNIGYAFLKAGKTLGISSYYQEGFNILTNFSEFKDDNERFIRDANLLYGSSGLTSFFRLLKCELHTSEFDSCLEYWQEKTKSFKRNENQWAGFSAHFNQFDINTPLSLTDGIIGIGISLMEQTKSLKDFRYLTFLNYSL